MGLLVRTWGEVTAVGDDWFYIDDGSNIEDGSGSIGVKVTLAGIVSDVPIQLPLVGDYVAVTGLSSCEPLPFGEEVARLLRPRCASDVMVVLQGE